MITLNDFLKIDSSETTDVYVIPVRIISKIIDANIEWHNYVKYENRISMDIHKGDITSAMHIADYSKYELSTYVGMEDKLKDMAIQSGWRDVTIAIIVDHIYDSTNSTDIVYKIDLYFKSYIERMYNYDYIK